MGTSCSANRLGWLLVVITVAATVVAPVEGESSAKRFDCLAESDDCPEVVVAGDPWQEIPGVGPSPFRGYGDPSVRRAPHGDRLWMTYSYLSLEPKPSAPSTLETAVSVHLASSDDDGETWRFRRKLAPSLAETDPALPGGAGLSVHEVSTLAPLVSGSKVRWFGLPEIEVARVGLPSIIEFYDFYRCLLQGSRGRAIPESSIVDTTLKVPEIEEREARMPLNFSGLGGLTHELRVHSLFLS